MNESGGQGALAGAPTGGLGPGGRGGGASAGAGRSTVGGAGSGGQGGSGGMTMAVTCMPVLMLDDLEDGDDLVCPNQGRSGEWWAATGTATGTTDPAEEGEFGAYALGADARGTSKYGMRLSGQGFGHTGDDWASLGFYLAGGSPYDLSDYDGLAFYAKSKAGALTLHVTFATATTTPEGEGGEYAQDCNDHFALSVVLGDGWQQFNVPLAELEQEGWGPKAKDIEHTLFVYFGFLGTDGGPATFDFLVDDVRVY